MSELAYLFLAILISTIGSAVIWYRHGQQQSLEAGVDRFSHGLQILESQVSQRRNLLRPEANGLPHGYRSIHTNLEDGHTAV